MTGTRYADTPLDVIFPDPEQPRRAIADARVGELAASIADCGLAEPVILRPRPSGTGYYLVAGETRWRAYRRLGRDTIPAVIRADITDDNAAFEAATVSALARADLDPFDEAAALRRIFHDRRLANNAALARIVGRSTSWVGDRLLLNYLPDDARARVRAGEMTLVDAVALARDLTGRTQAPRTPPPPPAASTRAGSRSVEEPIRSGRGFGSGRDPWRAPTPPPPTPPAAPAAGRRTWVIHVCRTCGELATFPFCAHRDEPRPEGAPSWCTPVVVTGTWRPAT